MTSKPLTSKLLKPVSPKQKVKHESLFSGIWIRWSALNAAEQLVCANIVLLPVWWAAGLLGYLPELMLAGIVVYDLRRYGELRLRRPSLVVVALFAFHAYGYVDTFLLFFKAYPSLDLPPDFVVKSTDLVKSLFSFSLPCLVWYVQSRDTRVRLEVVAWACSVSLIQMLVFWFVVQFFFPGLIVHPPRSLYGILTGKSGDYSDGAGAANYLVFYDEAEGRFRFFFGHYQACAAFLGFVSLLALDLKNRFWSFLILVACIFLMALVASRSVWLAFPAALFVYFLLTTRKVGGDSLLFALIAIASFVTLSLPPVTDLIFDTSTGTATTVGDYRAGSTEIRSRIYAETLEGIPEKPLFGHKVEDTIIRLNGEEEVGAGSHSFILGDLLYKGGLVAFGLFVTYWISLILWFYNTRAGRPVAWFPILVFFSLISSVTTFQWTMSICTLVCMMLRKPMKKPFRRSVA